MSGWIRLAGVGELSFGSGKTIEVNGCCLAVFRIAQGIFVLDGHCLHREAKLAEGEIAGLQVICPLRQCRFDIVSGVCLTNRDVQLGTYRVKVDGADIFVRFP